MGSARPGASRTAHPNLRVPAGDGLEQADVPPPPGSPSVFSLALTVMFQ